MNILPQTLKILIMILERKNGRYDDYKSLATDLKNKFSIDVTPQELEEFEYINLLQEDIEIMYKHCKL